MQRTASKLRPVALVALATLVAAAPAGAQATSFAWPVAGDVIRPYVNGSDRYAAGMHRGLDIAAPVGAAVSAAAGGSVSFAGRGPDGALTVTIRSADGRYLVSHLHLARVSVAKDTSIALGAPVGTVGTTGKPSSPAPHVHLGIRLAATGAYVDPATLLPARAPRQAAQPALPLAPALRPQTVQIRPRMRVQSRLPQQRPSSQPHRLPRVDLRDNAVERPRRNAPGATRGAMSTAAPGLTRRVAPRIADSLARRPALALPTPAATAASSSAVSRVRRQGPAWPARIALLAAAGLIALLLWRRRERSGDAPWPPASIPKRSPATTAPAGPVGASADRR